MKRPAFQFYPGDWQRDAALRSCSVGARGLWIEMICIMHQAEPYGHLTVNGNAILPPILARMVGAKLGEVIRWLGELESAGVCDRDGDTLISRRMVRDEVLRKVRAEGGKLGGNPTLMDKAKVPDKVNLDANLQPTPSSSTSSSTSKKNKPPFVLPDWVPPEDWDAFDDSRKKLRKPMTDFAKKLVVNELDRLRAQGDDPGEVLRKAVRKGWLDVFPLKGESAADPMKGVV